MLTMLLNFTLFLVMFYFFILCIRDMYFMYEINDNNTNYLLCNITFYLMPVVSYHADIKKKKQFLYEYTNNVILIN